MNKATIEVDSLTGIELDFYVAKAEGYDDLKKSNGWGSDDFLYRMVHIDISVFSEVIDIDWNFLGKIIERDKIIVNCLDGKNRWSAKHYDTRYRIGLMVVFGNTAIESIKKLIIKRKYGETINVNKKAG